MKKITKQHACDGPNLGKKIYKNLYKAIHNNVWENRRIHTETFLADIFNWWCFKIILT